MKLLERVYKYLVCLTSHHRKFVGIESRKGTVFGRYCCFECDRVTLKKEKNFNFDVQE